MDVKREVAGGRWRVYVDRNDSVGQAVSVGRSTFELVPEVSVPPESPLGDLVREVREAWAAPRPGGKPVCPHLAPALHRGVVFYGTAASTTDPEELADWMLELSGLFPQVQEALGPDGRLASLTVLVPFDDGALGSKVVETAHDLAKEAVIEGGQLIGEFGRELLGGGLRFPEVQTRRSAVGEYLVLRPLLRRDAKWVTSSEAWTDAFTRYFGGFQP